jgi:hypothetical protein
VLDGFLPAVAELLSLGHIVRAIVFIVLFVLVFAFATVRSKGRLPVVSTHNITWYGWPKSWLTVDNTIQPTISNSDGRREGGEQSIARRIDWQTFTVSATVAAGIAAILSTPLFFWLGRKKRKEYDQVA